MNQKLKQKRFCIIMAGGKGTRLWPESTTSHPKQYLPLMNGDTFLAHTLKRFEGLVELENRFIVTIKEQAKLADASSKGLIKRNALIMEPLGQNTAPCIFLSLITLLEQGARKEDIVAIVPADHAIKEVELYAKTLNLAYEAASTSKALITIGIRPEFPHTGFGYIERGSKKNKTLFKVKAFKEKPDLKTAKEYVKSGNYYWNAGMFVGEIGVILNEFKEHAPEIHKHFDAIKDNLKDAGKLQKAYEKITANSFDYAICEKTKNIMVIEGDFPWNDLGSWSALESITPKEEENYWVHNVANDGDYLVMNATDNIIYAPTQFVALYGVKDLVIVSNKNVLMIMPKSESEKVKDIVAKLNKNPKTRDLT